ncbi:MAG: retropepsin-like aspartic protease [Deltaproteobacteria bacterium]|nr:retropepsin-like aspartic protease [Deltaproteobacteria bacterium]
MPFFEGEIVNGQPIIAVAITLPDAREIKKNEDMFRALVDTGSNATLISEGIVRKLNLTSIEKGDIVGVTGKKSAVPIHRVDLHIPITELRPTKTQVFAQEHWKHIVSIEVTEFPGSKNFDVLLGMDILIHCHLTMFNGKFTIGF